jgi:hypothetical protein
MTYVIEKCHHFWYDYDHIFLKKNTNKCSFIRILAKDILAAQNSQRLMISWLVSNESVGR